MPGLLPPLYSFCLLKPWVQMCVRGCLEVWVSHVLPLALLQQFLLTAFSLSVVHTFLFLRKSLSFL